MKANWKPLKSGKVRDIFINEDKKLIALIATDRVSAFDNILPGDGIPQKGASLTSISRFWAFQTMEFPNAYVWNNDIIESTGRELGVSVDRITIQRLTEPLPIEAIVRGYITGSAWRAYQKGERMICGECLPDGLIQSSKLDRAYFTPTTKGEHDVNVTFEEMASILVKAGYTKEDADYIRKTSIQLYHKIHEIAKSKHLILADTKFEFGKDVKTGKLLVIDEIATPDSSRYWSLDSFKPGEAQQEYDKEMVRRNIAEQKAVGIANPSVYPEIVKLTSQRYVELKNMLIETS